MRRRSLNCVPFILPSTVLDLNQAPKHALLLSRETRVTKPSPSPDLCSPPSTSLPSTCSLLTSECFLPQITKPNLTAHPNLIVGNSHLLEGWVFDVLMAERRGNTAAESSDQQNTENERLDRQQTDMQDEIKPSTRSEGRPSSSRQPSESTIDSILAHARSKEVLLMNRNQAKNPMLKYIVHVRKEFHSGVVLSDFLCTPTIAVLYLSLQYHLLHPKYIYSRLDPLAPQLQKYKLVVLLALVDVGDHKAVLHELQSLALLRQLTLVCVRNEREAALWLETITSYCSAGANTTVIQEKVENNYAAQIHAALTAVRGVNKTDVSTLLFTFNGLHNIALASKQKLLACPGLGQRKVNRLYAALHQPFRTDVEWEDDSQNFLQPDDDDDDDGDDTAIRPLQNAPGVREPENRRNDASELNAVDENSVHSRGG